MQVCPAPVRAASSDQAASARIESRRLRRVNGYARTISGQDAEVVFRTRIFPGDRQEISDEWFKLLDKLAEGERPAFRKLSRDERSKLMHKRDDLPEHVRKQLEEAEEMKKRLAKLEEQQLGAMPALFWGWRSWRRAPFFPYA